VTRLNRLPSLTAAQVEVMNVFWQHGECSVTFVWKLLEERRGLTRNTVQTVIARLADKGWLRSREADNGSFLYSATVSQKAAQQRSVREMVDTVFDGSSENLVLALLSGGVSKAEAARIRKLILKSKKESE